MDGLKVFIPEGTAGSGKEGVDGGFVDVTVFLKAFTLYGPKGAVESTGDQVDADVVSAEVGFGKEVVP